MDGASNQKGSRVGLVLISHDKVIVEKSLRLDFSAMNNEAEYEVLMMGMVMVQRMGGKSVKVFSDSRLIIDQEKGEFEAKDERMQGYLSQVKCLQSKFESFDLLHIPRSGNAHWLCLEPPQHIICLGLSLLRICTSPQRQGKRLPEFIKL